MVSRLWLCLVCLLIGPAGLAWGQVVINEFLPDPAGSDAGKEFVELFNPGPQPVSLSGVRFQFANGADELAWETRWSAAPGDSLAGRGLFLIVDTNWEGQFVGDAQVRLSLQNGPDVVRLVQGDDVLDLVGYGPLTSSGSFEGHPVPVTSGLALARRPDGADSGDNAADFRSVEPSPGRMNFHPYQLMVSSWSSDPPSGDRPGLTHKIQAAVINEGLEALTAGILILQGAGAWSEASVGDMPSGAQRTVVWRVTPLAKGRFPLVMKCPLPGREDTLTVALGVLQVGPGPLVINEVQPAPNDHQGEWVELASATDSTLDLGGFQIRDEDGPWRRLPEYPLFPGGLVTIAQDSAALWAWVLAHQSAGDPGVSACEPGDLALITLGSWPSLNNTTPSTRDFADRLSLADAGGVVIDHVTYSESGGEDRIPLPDGGQSLERVALAPHDFRTANWGPCALGTGGTPGCPNSYPSPARDVQAMEVAPRVLAGGGAVAITLVIPISGAASRLRIYSLWGDLVRDLGPDHNGAGTRVGYWRGDDDQGHAVAPGGYIIVGDVIGPQGDVLARHKTLVGVQ